MPHHYFLGAAHLASAEVVVPNGGSHSLAYFCPTCGDIWARAVSTAAPEQFEIVVRKCQRHSPNPLFFWERVPGSLCEGLTTDISTMRWIAAIELLPEAVLLREFHLHYQHHFGKAP